MPAHTPAPDRRNHVTRWREQSPLSMGAFARSIGVAPSTFTRWVQDEDLVAPTFVELTPAPTPAPRTRPFVVGVVRDDLSDLRLVFDAPPPTAWLGALLRDLTSC